ncbi:MAG: hypothetical protein D6731_21815 [Planctomycetota bacterium]|nr:MAG: hypothetical protein D6731_21815 [Planctomycetota bacterium]
MPSAIPRVRSRAWALRRGQRFLLRCGWKDTWTHRGGPPTHQDGDFVVEYSFAAEVRTVRGRVATLAATVRSVHLEGAGVALDTEDRGAAFLSLRSLVGREIVLHLDQPSGRVRRVLGIDRLLDEVLDQVPEVARPTLRGALAHSGGERLRRRLDPLWHFGPARLGEPAPEGRELRFWLGRDNGIAFVAAAQETPSGLRWTATRRPSADRLPPTTEVLAAALAGEATLGPGFVREATATFRGRVRLRGAEYDVDYVVRASLRPVEGGR